MSNFDDANTCIDRMIDNVAGALQAMDQQGINRHQAVSMLIGSFLNVADRINPHDAAVEHALCLVRLAEWRDLIGHLEDEADMLHACMNTIDELDGL